MKIALSGSLTYDHIMTIPERLSEHILPEHIDKLNLSLVATTLRKSRGGTAGNTMYTMRMLGVTPLVVGVLGTDSEDYLAYMKVQKIPATYIGHDKRSLTPSVYITGDKDGNQITTYYGGIDRMSTPSMHSIKEKMDLVLVSPSGNTLRHMRECNERGLKTIFDPGQISTQISRQEFREMMSKAMCYIGNEYEFEVMLERTGWTTGKILSRMELIIVTRGEKGSDLYSADGKVTCISPCKVKFAKDPTGGGDAYRAAFLAGLTHGYDYVTSAQMGSVAGAYCVEEFGGQAHKFTQKEFCARYKKCYQKTITL